MTPKEIDKRVSTRYFLAGIATIGEEGAFMKTSSDGRHWVRKLVTRFVAALFCAALLAILIAAFVYRDAVYRRFVLFPRQAKAWEALRSQAAPVTLDDGWNEYRGVCHSHSELSHDSEVPFPEILAALKRTDSDFIFMSDHCDEGKADFSKQWRGNHDGVTFIPGYEMAGGFMPFGLPSDTVLDSSTEPHALAREIRAKGGLLFFAHTEEDRLWDLPELNGMEIYNLHTDFKDERFGDIVPDIILSMRSYPKQMLRLLFDPQTAILRNWDELNKTRKIVGIAGNDCHQNTGFRGFYTDKDSFLITNTGDRDPIKEWKLNFVTRLLVRAFPGPLEPGRQLFRIDVDRYELSALFSGTHVLAKSSSEQDLMEALGAGRVFVAFDMIASARGFVFLAESNGTRALMGDSIPFGKDVVLKAASPYPCRFKVLRDGTEAYQCEGRSLEWKPLGPGKYRVEAELNILDTWTPWVYTNPINVPAQANLGSGKQGLSLAGQVDSFCALGAKYRRETCIAPFVFGIVGEPKHAQRSSQVRMRGLSVLRDRATRRNEETWRGRSW